MNYCESCVKVIPKNSIACIYCGGIVYESDQLTSIVIFKNGEKYKIFTINGINLIKEIETMVGYIDFDGSKTGVFLPGDIKSLLLMNGFGPTYRFTSRSAAHRALYNAGWRSTSGKRVGQSAFYEV